VAGPEHTPSNGERFSPYEFHLTASRSLLEQGRYRGDAHHLVSNITLVDADGSTSPGYYRLKDYQAWCSNLFEFKDPDDPIGADPEEQRRLLRIARSVLGIQLHDSNDRLQQTSYTSCWPQDLRPGSTIGFIYFYPEEDWWHPPFEDQTLWTPDAPTLVRSTEIEPPEILTDPSGDPHLAQIFQQLNNT
jgi:hypothetical protein